MQQDGSDCGLDVTVAANDVGIEALAAKLSTYLTSDHVEMVRDAYRMADLAHKGQTRKSGEPYVSHPLAVACILGDMHLDHQTLCAAILHDVIEDTHFTKEDIAERFDNTIAELVDGVSKLTQMKFANKAIAQAENFQKMALAMAKDIRVIIVKLADRLHNIRTLGALSTEKKKRIAQETLDIYAPLALRLGINAFRVEYEDRCFEAIYPMRASRMKAALAKSTEQRQELLDKIAEQISQALSDAGFNNVTVFGRQKHLFSIYSKMKRKHKSLSDIMDVYACRVVVESPDDCYRALGVLHRLYKPVSRKFKDYIAIPKANGYQSLHTVLFGMRVPIEVQIRTQEMDEMASRGVAAHWLYKSEKDDPNENFTQNHLRATRWLQSVLEMQERSSDSMEFVEHFKTNLFSDEVYVFTPKGDILELPVGSTAIDFAYAVHTDIGNTCVGCFINRKPAMLNEPLQSGQTIRVLTAQDAQPKENWLNFVVTGKARSNIRHFIKQKIYRDSTSLGKKMINKHLLAHQLPEWDALDQKHIDALLNKLDYGEAQHLLEDVGLGNRPSYLTVNMLDTIINNRGDDETESADKSNNAIEADKKSAAPLSISGTEGMFVNFARCCFPVPGDRIAGCMNGGHGIDVHKQQCGEFKDIIKKGRHIVSLHWAEDVNQKFSAAIRVKVEMSSGALPFLAAKLDTYNMEIANMQQIKSDAQLTEMRVELMVYNRDNLARVMRLLRNSRRIVSVIREHNA